MKICIYAFANTAYFFEELIKTSRLQGDAPQWSVVLPRWHHKERLAALVSADQLLYLYEDFDARYAQCDSTAEFGLSDAVDGELLCLLKDKGGYIGLDGKEQLKRAAVVVEIYREFLIRTQPDYMLFPDLEVVDGFLLLSLCRSLGIKPIYYVGMRFLGGGFFSGDAYEGLPSYFGTYTDAELATARAVLASFVAAEPFAIDPPVVDKPAALAIAPLWSRVPKAVWMHLRKERRYVGEDGWMIRIKSNLGRVLSSYRHWYFRSFQYRWFDIVHADQPLPRKYVLYALQYTPESSINGLEPYYVDQMRVIDLLLAGMPSDCRLVVKEHPAILGVRSNSFYRQLLRKPGLVLAAPGVPTRRLMDGAAVVASVTGTIGFESYLRGKPCVLFGRNFFSHLCAFGGGASSIKRVLSDLLTHFQAPSMEERAQALARLLHVRYPILLSDPIVQPEVCSKHNVQAYLDALNDHMDRLAQAGPEQGN